MALKKVRGNIERMFDKNLTDLVRGIRNSKENEVRTFHLKIKSAEKHDCFLFIVFIFLSICCITFDSRLNI